MFEVLQINGVVTISTTLKTYEIPISSSQPHFSQETELLGTSYVFEFEWLEHQQYWLMHIFDVSGAPLFLGLRLQLNWPLLRRYKGKFPGELLLLPKSNESEISLGNLKDSFRLVFHAPV